MEARKIRRESLTEHYITALPEDGSKGAARAVFEEVAEHLAREGIAPIMEKVYGLRGAREEHLEMRAKSFSANLLEPHVPLTYIEGRPVAGALAGVQIWGVSPLGGRKLSVRTLSLPGGLTGRSLHMDDCWLLYLPAIRGQFRGDEGPGEQAAQMFRAAHEALRELGLNYSCVIRTWIYLAHLLDWYGEFNQVRTAFFREAGLLDGAEEAIFPASTAIQGQSEDEECMMDLLAMADSSGSPSWPIRSTSRQGPSFGYGSAFSRAMGVRFQGKSTIYVSGTASIDALGRTVHGANPEAQAMETLLNIASLLEDQGGGLESISMATCFFQSLESYQAYQRLLRLLGIGRLPSIPLLAQACRPDLLVEVEAVAVI